MNTVPKKHFFAASNSADGFVNYFSRIFDPIGCRRLYVIRGGPGTGKSSFMRAVAKRAEEKGLSVVRYFCSSDPESLDGLWIDGVRVGLIDGTAPHSWEPTQIGAFEQTVDLGAFWREQPLIDARERICDLSQKKKQCYEGAYRYLAAYGRVAEDAFCEIQPFVKTEKMARAAARLLAQYAPVSRSAFWETVGLCDSIGMSGRVRFGAYEDPDREHIRICDVGGIGYRFLGELYRLCRLRGISVRVSYHPILPSYVDAIELIDHGVTFSLAEGKSEERQIHMKRFIDEEGYRKVRKNRRKSMRIGEALLLRAEEKLAEAATHHFLLESIFGSAMDFDAKEQRQEEFCRFVLRGV